MNTDSMALSAVITMMMMDLTYAQNAAMYCYEDTYYVNDFDGNQNTIKTDYFFNGEYSYHDSYYEDRRFKFRYCKPSSTSIGPFTNDMSTQLSDTAYDEEWYRTCSDINGGHAAIHGIVSWHDSYTEDRQFQIYCGSLDLTKHRLENCFTSSTLNSYDGTLDYDCPNNGVIRSIWSTHNSYYEDRLFSFECCNIVDVTYEFSNIVGEWDEKHSCFGCLQHEYMKEFGTESSVVTSIESSYSNELSATVSAGFEFQTVFASSIEITGTVSESISRSMESAFSTSYSESTTFTCEMTYLYQWVISGDEERSDGSSGTFYSYSNDYLCTNNASPKCPPGYCTDSDCETCADDF